MKDHYTITQSLVSLHIPRTSSSSSSSFSVFFFPPTLSSPSPNPSTSTPFLPQFNQFCTFLIPLIHFHLIYHFLSVNSISGGRFPRDLAGICFILIFVELLGGLL